MSTLFGRGDQIARWTGEWRGERETQSNRGAKYLTSTRNIILILSPSEVRNPERIYPASDTGSRGQAGGEVSNLLIFFEIQATSKIKVPKTNDPLKIDTDR